MDPFDKEAAARVWSRVLAPNREEIPWELLLTNTRRGARAYFALSQRAPGALRESLRQLSREKEGQYYCLLGLFIQQKGGRPRLPPEQPLPREGLVPALERRYREETALYQALETGGDLLLGVLGARVRENLLTVLELLGREQA